MEGVEKEKKAILSTGVERDEKMQHPRQRSSQERPLLPATWWEAPTGHNFSHFGAQLVHSRPHGQRPKGPPQSFASF